MNDDFRSIVGMLDALWSRLQPSTLLTLATRRTDGGAAARMVILRESNREAALLTIYTHGLSEKIDQIAQDPSGELLLWDSDARFQARLLLNIAIEPGTREVWDGLGDGARLNYARQPLPGAEISKPVTPQSSNVEHLTILNARIERIDLLHLGKLPHRRATYSAEDGFAGRWIAP